MLKTVLIAVALAIVALLAYAATRPDTFRVERTAVIQAPPERIFAILSDFRQWGGWSPWEKKDPGMQRTYGATTVGKGATYAWAGNQDVGRGSMEIVEASAPHRLTLRLDFSEPFEAHNMVDFTLQPAPGATSVTWALYGPMPFISKVMSIFVSMDRMVGGDFEAGLANLKALAERP